MKATSEKKLKLGWISYLNLFPLKYEIQKNLSDNFELSYGPPSKINKLLREDSVQLAPSSSICLLRDDPLYTIPIGV